MNPESNSRGKYVLRRRSLVVTADDFGIGPETTRGILDLAMRGRITATVLLVNSPYAEGAVDSWRQAGRPVELGWHPCLTLDRPICDPAAIPSLVTADGKFPSLAGFLRFWAGRRLCPHELRLELTAQHQRFLELVGSRPAMINSHHHVQVFPPVGAALREVLSSQRPRPYLRRIVEAGATLAGVRGALAKRLFLSSLGLIESRRQREDGFPGNEALIGVTDPPFVHEPDFLEQWLRASSGTHVELTCHPGCLDASLVGRDCRAGDGQLERRVRERDLLQSDSFPQAAHAAGFRIVSPDEFARSADVRASAA